MRMRVLNRDLTSSPVPEVDPGESSEILESLISTDHKLQGFDTSLSSSNDDCALPPSAVFIESIMSERAPRLHKYRRSVPVVTRKQRVIVFILLLLVGHRCLSLIWWNRIYKATTVADWEAFSNDYHQRFGRYPSDDFNQWLTYAKHHQCETSEYYDIIDRNLKVFRSDHFRSHHLSLDDIIEEATTYSNGYVLFVLNQNKLSIEKIKDNDSAPNFGGRPWWLAKAERYYKEWALRWLLEPLVRHQPPISTKFVWNLMDEPIKDPKVPIFSACTTREDFDDHESFSHNDMNDNAAAMPSQKQQITSIHNSAEELSIRDLPIPYHFSIGTIGTRGAGGNFFFSLLNRFRFSNQPWRDRDDVITWRGSSTGAWEKGPRFHLVNTEEGGMSNPQVWNQVNSSHVQTDFAFVKRSSIQVQSNELNPKYRVAERMTFRDMQKYKYVVDLDGNSFSERFPKLLTSGTLVFKATKFQEWFSERVQPWVHYIPVSYDLSDLPALLSWADQNPNSAEQMVTKARQVVEQHLRPNDQRCYVYRMLLEYQALFREQS